METRIQLDDAQELKLPPRPRIALHEALQTARASFEKLGEKRGFLGEFDREHGKYGCRIIDTLKDLIPSDTMLTDTEWGIVDRAISCSASNEAEHRIGQSGWLNHSIMEIAVFIKNFGVSEPNREASCHVL